MSSQTPTLILLVVLLFSSSVICQTADEQARSLFREGHTLGKQPEEAKKRLGLEKLQQAVRLFQQTNQKHNELIATFSAAYVAEILGEWKIACEMYPLSLSLFTDGPNKKDLPDLYFSIGRCSMFLGERTTAIDYFNRAGALWKLTGEIGKQATTENDVGALYYELGRYDDALKYLEPALEKRKQLGNRCDTAATLSNIAIVHLARSQWSTALDLLQKQALPLHNTATECALGEEYSATTDCPDSLAATLINIGKVHYDLADYKAALCFYERALPFVKYEPFKAALINNLGTVQYALKNYPSALARFEEALKLQSDIAAAEALTNIALTKSRQQSGVPFAGMAEALRLRREIGDAKGEAATRNSLAEVYIRLKRPKDALESLNHAIPLFHSAGDRSGEATALTNAMIAWRMMGNRKAAIEKGKSSVTLFQQLRLEARVARGEIERTYLRTVRQAYQNLAELLIEEALYEQAIEVLSFYQDTQWFGRPEHSRTDIKQLIKAQQSLATLPSLRAVPLYTLVAETKLYILAVTSSGIKVFVSAIAGAALNQQVHSFHYVLQCANRDPYQAASALYFSLFHSTLVTDSQMKLETFLRNENAGTLLWSLDAPLDSVPMAALYNGNQEKFLIEQYRIAVFTRADAELFRREPLPWLNGIGLGTSKQFTGQDPIPGAEVSLAAIFGNEVPRRRGMIKGQTVVNDEFTGKVLEDLDGRWPLVHIMSHFEFSPGDSEASFLRLGDGGRYTLAQMRAQPDLFAGVDLLAVPICETAVHDPDFYGKQMEAFADLAQQVGANSVLASLWKVSYHVTPKLMHRFYELARAHPGWSKAELLRQAQLGLLRGEISIVPQRGITRGSCGSESTARWRSFDRKRPFAHPYYWSAFVLYGNAR